jgi:hypothetical protein
MKTQITEENLTQMQNSTRFDQIECGGLFVHADGLYIKSADTKSAYHIATGKYTNFSSGFIVNIPRTVKIAYEL